MFVKNDEIHEVLKSVPKNANILTNDLSYNGYKLGAQMQYSSILGHQFYGANFLYHGNVENGSQDKYLDKISFFKSDLNLKKVKWLNENKIDYILLKGDLSGFIKSVPIKKTKNFLLYDISQIKIN
tara:strand:- start:66 stop:443 length:378 start_codon:yes stop_codon:yes gene_type:complete